MSWLKLVAVLLMTCLSLQRARDLLILLGMSMDHDQGDEDDEPTPAQSADAAAADSTRLPYNPRKAKALVALMTLLQGRVSTGVDIAPM